MIDDEPVIVEGLKKIIDWGSIGYEIVATAYDGIDGLDKILTLEPDVALVDIRIPGIDGLLLIEKIKQKGLKTKVIILSGYSEFEYARKAIELGVESYLLKPINADLLVEKLQRLKTKIIEENSFNETLHNTIKFSKDKVIEMLITGSLDEIDIETVNRLFDLKLPWKIYQVAIVQIISNDLFYSQNHLLSEKLNHLKKEIDLFLSKNCSGYSVLKDNQIYVLFKDFFYPFNSRSFNILKKRLVSQFKGEMVISIGSEVDDYKNIKNSYEEANNLLEKRFQFGYKGIIYIKEEQSHIETKKIVFDDEENTNKLAAALELNGFEIINNVIESKADQLMLSKLSEEEIKIDFSNFYINTLYKLSQNQLYKPIVEKYLSQQVLRSFYVQKSLTELKGVVKYYMALISDEIFKMQPDNLKQRIVEFIDANYQKNVKLETIAYAFGYNSSYFSKLFKKVFGENYTSYLDKVKVQKAKQFLMDGYKVSEVAKKVGYDDVDYFCAKFKKYVGESPKNYRNGHK